MSESAIWSDYIIVVHKRKGETIVNPPYSIALDVLVSTKGGKLIINPIYRVLSRSKDGVQLQRRRADQKWEFECLAMMKAMPLDLFIPTSIMNDVKQHRVTQEMEPLLRRGVVLAVPTNFI